MDAATLIPPGWLWIAIAALLLLTLLALLHPGKPRATFGGAPHAPKASAKPEIIEMAVIAEFRRTEGDRAVWDCPLCRTGHRLPDRRSGTLRCRGCGTKLHAG